MKESSSGGDGASSHRVTSSHSDSIGRRGGVKRAAIQIKDRKLVEYADLLCEAAVLLDTQPHTLVVTVFCLGWLSWFQESRLRSRAIKFLAALPAEFTTQQRTGLGKTKASVPCNVRGLFHIHRPKDRLVTTLRPLVALQRLAPSNGGLAMVFHCRRNLTNILQAYSILFWRKSFASWRYPPTRSLL